jgi:hypothetical protein
MFGRHKMTHGGTATVVRCDAVISGIRAAGGKGFTLSGTPSMRWDLILDVSPDGAPPFRVETSQRFAQVYEPNVGDTLRVRCDPERQTVAIDLSEDERFNPKLSRRAKAAAGKEERERLLQAPPGTPTTDRDQVKLALEEARRRRGSAARDD